MPKAPRNVSRHHGKRSSTVALVLSMLLMLSVVLLVLLALGILSLPVPSDDDTTPLKDRISFKHQRVLIWQSRTVHANLTPVLNQILSLVIKRLPSPYLYECGDGDGDGLGKRGDQWTEILSWGPRAFLYHNFLSKEECEYLISIAKPHMVKSTVVDSKTGQSKDSSTTKTISCSQGPYKLWNVFDRGRDKTIREIEKRIADFTFIPVEHGEGLQVLHYEEGQKYEPHFDYFLDEFNTKNGGQRIATVLMYLSDVEEGGETVFPSAKANFSSVPWWNDLSECAKKGLSVKPKMGDALLFWSMRPDASLDPSSLHGGCPVIKGNKWSSTKWMHVGEYKI